MEKIIFECETITPMFLGGADGKTPELRPPSIKAAMRFWWRALNADLSIEELRKKEAKIFGGSGESEGRSSVLIRVLESNLKYDDKLLPKHEVNAIHKPGTKISILNYLTFGPCTYEKGKGNFYNRKYILPNSIFKIKISFNKERITKNSLILLFELIAYVGGLGTKSRNGFGRFNFKIKDDTYTKNIENLIRLIKSKKNDQSNFTSFSKDIRAFKLNQLNISTWDKSLAKIGEIYLQGRESLDSKHIYDNRQHIAAPIIVGPTQKSILDRHSKNYFLTIIQEGDKYLGYIFFLPYNYCSDHPKLSEIIRTHHLSQTQLKSSFDVSTNNLNTFFDSKMGEIK